MKKATFILVMISILGCSTDSSLEVVQANDTDQVTDKIEPLVVDFVEHNYDLSMYNDPYKLTISPEYMFHTNNHNANIILTKNLDTIINASINIDTINNRYYELYQNDTIERLDFASDYVLNDMVYDFVRTESLYLSALLKPKTDTTTLPVIIKFKYLGDRTGKFWVNVL